MKDEIPLPSYRGERALELALVLAILPFALVLGLPIALVNCIGFGSWRDIFFVQRRVGLHGERFLIFKFKTMRPTADGPVATRFGRFLRCTHLDELPQLINVLRGEMTVIGPRPEMCSIHEWACKQVDGFDRRLVTKPGITGFAQITQGYAAARVTCYREKLAADLIYLHNRSLGFDLMIALWTTVWIVRGRGWRPRSDAVVTRRTRQPVGALDSDARRSVARS